MQMKAKSPVPDHVAPLSDGEWGLWRWVFLRSAGFPAEGMRELADAECSAAADRLIDATAKVLRQRQSYQQFLRAWITFHPETTFHSF